MPTAPLEPASVIHIWDDPESKIQFMERTLHGKDWRTVILYPDNTPQSQQKRQTTKQELEARGFLVREDTDDRGNAILHVHHIGDGTHLLDLFKEAGLASGTLHVASHASLPMRYLLRGYQNLVDWVGDVLDDPARINGFTYATAEGFLAAAGLGNTHGNISDLKNGLQSLAGGLWLSQSLTYLGLARTNDELALDQLKKKVKYTSRAGAPITQIRYDAEKDKEPEGIGHSLVRMIRKYPIQLGAILNNLGMLSYLGHVFLEHRFQSALLRNPNATKKEIEHAMQYVSKGVFYDALGPLLSLVAWSFLLIPPKKHEAKEGEGIVEKTWGIIKENPQYATGLFTLGSSGSRLAAAAIKKNTIQVIGESIYLLGDFALFFTNSSEYGGGHEQNINEFGAKVAKYLRGLPLVLGPQTRQEFVRNIAQYVIEKDVAMKGKVPMTRTELNARMEALSRAILKHIETHNPHLEQLAETSGTIARHFQPDQQHAIFERIAEALKQLPGVEATPEELINAMRQSVAAAEPQHRASKLVQMKDISEDVAKLAFAVPHLDAASTASLIYDALLPFTRQQASDQHILGAAMTQQAMQHLHLAQAQSPSTQMTR